MPRKRQESGVQSLHQLGTYRTEAYRWFRVGEGTMDNFMFSALSASPAAKGAPAKATPVKK
jgi:hypothetical protein